MGCLNVTASRKNGIVVSSRRAGLFSAAASRIDAPKISCGLVCSVRTERTLEISPKHIFLMEANGYTDEVYIVTNATWNLS